MFKHLWVSLLVFSAIAFSACIPNSGYDKIVQAEKMLLTGQRTIISVATAADSMCKAQIIEAATCVELFKVYTQTQDAYAVAVDAVQIADKAGTAESWQEFLLKEDVFFNLLNDLIELQKPK